MNETLNDFETLLQNTLEISQQLSCQSSQAQNNSERVDQIILEIQVGFMNRVVSTFNKK